ncbi:alpha/beta hydrolase [Rhodoferax sp.]|uniref:alpha/beta fold hydrolase n=1 Tax=Rhodoferax sp. TaxID=50421 RepID=UPI0026032A61|nr:alpha/beta hydrolase [Rhodoferax sp.]MDD2925819.1 alpha/beta hydrolase [Rhodoferax sp.]
MTNFGATHGKLVVYFHGAPGAPEEFQIFDQEAQKHGLTVFCLDRFAVNPAVTGEAYYQLLAKEIARQAAGQPVDVIGFSIGAFIALQTCRYLPHGVKSLHLVSAAAPLEAGAFLPTMAGQQVFRLAKAAPALFLLLSYWQSLLAWLAPQALFRLLFASAAGADQALAADPEFQAGITPILRACFRQRVRGYARDVVAYVQPWSATLADMAVPTQLWHGDADNWSPPQMAQYLASAIAGHTSSQSFSGLSHYSCLYRAVPEICRLLGRASLLPSA